MEAVAEVKYGHANDDAVRDLLQDDRAVGVGDFGVDFHASINGARMHDDRVGLEPFGAFLVEAEHAGVFAE